MRSATVTRCGLRLRDIALVLYALGCSRPAALSPDDTAAVAAAVRLQFDSLVGAIRRVDVDRMLAAYADDSALTRALDGRLLRGRAAVEQDFRDGFRAVRQVDSLVVAKGDLRVLSPTAAVLTVPLREVFTVTAGVRTTLHGTWTSVWSRGPKGWRIVQDAAVHVPESNR
ncbi:MAG: hypothetical protein DMD26_16505 [Gemmatimonadetes bacterium]|nr:MAG: hypothetical protein DMD26_16505 [Gemmatimonadota bacterium]